MPKRYVSVLKTGHPVEAPKTNIERKHKPAQSDKNDFRQHRKEEFKRRHATR